MYCQELCKMHSSPGSHRSQKKFSDCDSTGSANMLLGVAWYSSVVKGIDRVVVPRKLYIQNAVQDLYTFLHIDRKTS